MNRRRDHYAELLELIGEHGLILLAEQLGGTRVMIPSDVLPEHIIARAIGIDAARRLADRLAPDAIQVPLARELRARHYRAQGESHAQIARRLGLTEGGVLRILRRATDKPPLTPPPPPPLPLFPDA